MASLSCPATPATPVFVSAPTTPATPTGSWQHPEMDKVIRRQAENTFTDASIYKLSLNAAVLVASFVLISILSNTEIAVSLVSVFPPTVLNYSIYALWALRILFLFNVGDMLYRAFCRPDDFSDIALTPEQRKLLGLGPGTPRSPCAAPESFTTPPRYIKSTPTSRSASPLPGNSSPTMQRKAALSGQGMGMSVYALGTPSPLSSPLRMGGGEKSLWGSPRSPVSGGTSSVTPSNRWAYEKSILSRKADGMRLSPSKSLFGSPR